jgi:hypothetical protein
VTGLPWVGSFFANTGGFRACAEDLKFWSGAIVLGEDWFHSATMRGSVFEVATLPGIESCFAVFDKNAKTPF